MDDPGGQRFGLAPIDPANQPLFKLALSSVNEPLSDYTFACNYMWGACLKLYWLVTDRHLCVFANGTGDLTMLIPPMALPGAADADLRDCLGRCFEVMDAYNDAHATRGQSRIEYVSDEVMEHINSATMHGPLNLGATPMSGDYVYDMARMIDLAGGSLKSKRHARSKFLREHPDARTEPYAHAHFQSCLTLLDQWHHHGDSTHQGEVNEDHVGSDILRSRDSLASARALQHYDTLGLTGMVLIADEKVIGFTLGEALPSGMASILIEKTHHNYEGSAQFIFSEFCRQHWSHLPMCNAGDDWGLPALRFTKQSYRPMRILNKSVLKRSQLPLVMGYTPAATDAGFALRASDEPAPPACDSSMDMGMHAASLPTQDETAASHADGQPHHDRGFVTPFIPFTPPASPLAVFASADETPDLGHPVMNDSQSHSPDVPPADPPLVEPALPCDLDAILALETLCFEHTQERFCRRQIRALLQNPRATVLVARHQNRVVGWTSTLIRQDRAGRTGRIYAIAVHPDMQGRRIGQKLLLQGLQRLAQLAPRRVVLEVRQGNHHAIALYEKIGFTIQQPLLDYYGHGYHGYRMTCPTTLLTQLLQNQYATTTAANPM